MGEAKRRKLAARRSQVVKPSLTAPPSKAIAASLLAALSMGVSKVALAQVCSGLGTSTVTCPSGTYATGIVVSQPAGATTDLNVTLQNGVNVTGQSVQIFNGENSPSPTNASVVMENGAKINVTEPGAPGLRLQNGDPNNITLTGGNATITAAGTINVQSNIGTRLDAIQAINFFNGAASKVIYTGPSGGVGTVLDLTSSGFSNGTIIQAVSAAANGNATVEASGNMLGFLNPGERFFQGLGATVQGNGNATLLYDKGTLTVQGRNAAGIFAGNGDGGGGVVTVVTGPDTHIINSGTNPGESTPTLNMTPGITAEIGKHCCGGWQDNGNRGVNNPDVRQADCGCQFFEQSCRSSVYSQGRRAGFPYLHRRGHYDQRRGWHRHPC